MSIENSRRNSIDGQWIRDNETKEFEYGYSKSEDSKTVYQKIVERLALNKIRNELIFKGMLDAQLRSFARDGITITREQLIQDINKEVARQRTSFDLNNEDTDTFIENLDDVMQRLSSAQSQSQQIISDQEQQIERMKNNLENIFESAPAQTQPSVNANSTIPKEPSIESASVKSALESTVQQPVHTEQEKKEIREQMRQAQDQLSKTLEWAKQQPNEPQFTSTRSDNIEEAPEWTKDRGVSGYTEPTLDQVRQGLESHNQQVQQDQQNKDSLINGIIERMADAGDFSYIPLEDVSQRVDVMNMVRKRLQEKSIDELEVILNSYANQGEKTESTGMHR